MIDPTPEYAAIEALFARIDAAVAEVVPVLDAVETVGDLLWLMGGDAA